MLSDEQRVKWNSNTMGIISSIVDMVRSVAPSLIMLTIYFLFQLWNGRNDEPYDEESGPLNVNTTREWMFLMEGTAYM